MQLYINCETSTVHYVAAEAAEVRSDAEAWMSNLSLRTLVVPFALEQIYEQCYFVGVVFEN